ncbi:hypothetical protein [Runella zeae]|uniref:hypothetical protein n=1 Tax=Runella zeae TaxID=94255 RepID=UPI002353558D|nr:hypothetical protein [Runella zeae]
MKIVKQILAFITLILIFAFVLEISKVAHLELLVLLLMQLEAVQLIILIIIFTAFSLFSLAIVFYSVKYISVYYSARSRTLLISIVAVKFLFGLLAIISNSFTLINQSRSVATGKVFAIIATIISVFVHLKIVMYSDQLLEKQSKSSDTIEKSTNTKKSTVTKYIQAMFNILLENPLLGMNRNRLIAREFSTLLYSIAVSFIISFLVFILFSVYNYTVDKRTVSLEVRIKEANKVSLKLSSSYDVKSEKQRILLGRNIDVTNKKVINLRNKHIREGGVSEENWNRLISKTDVKNFFLSQGVNSKEKFALYIDSMVISKNDIDMKEKSDSLKVVALELSKHKYVVENEKLYYDSSQIPITFIYVLVWALVIIFPLRYLLYAIQWSARVLSQNN